MYVRRVCVACGYNGMQWVTVFVTLLSFLTFFLTFFLSFFVSFCLPLLLEWSLCFSPFLFTSLAQVESLHANSIFLCFFLFLFLFFPLFVSISISLFASFTRVESLHMKS